MDPSLVDSHAHLSVADFDEDRDQVIKRAFRQGISAILCPAELTESPSLVTTLNLTQKYHSIIAAAGVHPHKAKSFTPDCLKKIEQLAGAKEIHAVGEIGLDFHYNFSSPGQQQEALRAQLQAAQKLALPVILHSRKSGKEIIRAIEEEHFTRGGVVHCFTEDWQMARRIIDEGFFISFSGIITFPKAHSLREVARKIPAERLLVETDSPYLLPQRCRGRRRRNEPAYVREVAGTLSEIKDVSMEEMAEKTTNNFQSLFMFEI
jgi:TatD DNase family protein